MKSLRVTNSSFCWVLFALRMGGAVSQPSERAAAPSGPWDYSDGIIRSLVKSLHMCTSPVWPGFAGNVNKLCSASIFMSLSRMRDVHFTWPGPWTWSQINLDRVDILPAVVLKSFKWVWCTQRFHFHLQTKDFHAADEIQAALNVRLPFKCCGSNYFH